MNRIDKLTPEQEEMLPAIRDEWERIGLCTEPADRPRAESAIKAMYAQAGLAEPRIVWCDSPLAMALTHVVVQKIQAHSVWASVGDSVRDSVRASVWASVGDSVRASVWASVGDSVGDSVWDSVWDSVFGQHDAHWLGFFDAFRLFGLERQTAPVAGLTEYARSAGWCSPHDNICWASERHHILRRDTQGSLHCADGPAIEYPDGWAIYAWHGLRVPREMILEPVNPDEIMRTQNAEHRRVLLERYGLNRFIAERGTLIHEDWTGRLMELRHPDGIVQRVAVVVNGTPGPDGVRKEYALSVPTDVSTCHEAVAATYPMLDGSRRPAYHYHLHKMGRT